MEMTGKVMIANVEDKELVTKEGTKRAAKVSHVVLVCKVGKRTEVCNVRCYDAMWSLPDIGTDWTTPRVRQYTNYDGNVAEVSVCPSF